MLDITNNNIVTMSRGDNQTLPLKLFYGTTDNLTNITYFLNRNDKIFFGICEPNQNFEDAILKKAYTYEDVVKNNSGFVKDGIVNIKFDSIDTEFLHEGTYYYTVKLLKKSPFKSQDDSQGRLETIISKTKFILID